ncbi:MAG: NPCBM/NEW2 domain-containing protein [Armatimonadota bacterium]
MNKRLLTLLLALFLAPAYAKEGVSLLTPQEAEAVKAALPKTPSVPWGLAEATDEQLWNYVPPASLRRAVFLGPTDVGCPVHGVELFRVGGGFYPWLYSSDKPWQVKCPVGGETYPSNDFGAYLKSGMKDQSLLTGPYADDGTGWVDANGKRFFFAGYWVFHQRWYDVLKAITGFTDAYFATGNEEYAHKAAVLFCALAEQYPKMDYPKQGTQGCGGMILPWCWENQTVVTPMSTAYDRLFPYLRKDGDEALREFLKARTDLGPRKQIEQRFMQTVAKTELTTDMYWSNECDHQLAFADWALAWDNNDPADGVTTKQAIEWIINDGGDNSLEELILNSTYRDGFPCEGAIGYSSAVASRLVDIAERLRRCGYDLFKQYPRLKQVAGCWIDMAFADGHTASIGDAGNVLGSGRVGSAQMFHLGWENYRDPKFAQALAAMKNTRYAPYTPDRTAEFEQVLKQHGAQPLPKTRNLGGMGLAMLESGGSQYPRGVALYYGSPAGGHAHHDRLNIEFFDHRQSMLPDLGYPDQWGAKAQHFTQNSIGHYTVLVDEQGEKDYKTGYLDFIKGSEGVQVVSARAERCFPGTSLYRRETALVDLSAENCYLFDVFRVRGGKQHDWSFHLPPVPEWGVEGLKLSEPGKGTLAGEDVAEGAEWAPKNGFNWLVNPRRAKTSGNFTLLSKANPPYPELRMTMLAGCADEVIVADHESPRVKASLPPHMKWLVARRKGNDNLSSAFAAIIEASPGGPKIQQVRRLETTGGTESVAAEIKTAAYTDTLFSDETGEKPIQLKSGGQFHGRWGMVRRDATGVKQAMLIGGSKLSMDGVQIETIADWRGKISAVDYKANTLDVNVPLPAGETLKGEWMIISNGRHSTCYEIASVTPQGTGSRIQLTEVSPMVGKGYVEKTEEDKRIIHTDTRWRIFGKDQIWSNDFGPVLTGYRLLNEDLSAGLEIEDCKLMPSRAREWWKPEPAWIRLAGKEPFADLFKDSNGDGKRGWWVYDFGPGFDFRITGSVSLRRTATQAWQMDHRGARVQVSLPSATALTDLIVRDGGGRAQVLPCKYDAKLKLAQFAIPAGLRGPVAVALRSGKGVNLADTEPPVVTEIRVDGKLVSQPEIAQVFLPDPPESIEISAQDALNPLDPKATFVQSGERTVYAGQPGVTLQLDATNPRRGILRIEPAKFLSFSKRDEGTAYSLSACLNDAGVTGKETRLNFRFILSPKIPEGSVYLSDLASTKAFGHGGLIRDRNYLGDELRLGGLLYPKGLMLCPETTTGPVNFGEAIYSIPPGKFQRLRAMIGISDATQAGSVIFSVQLRKNGGEWREAFKSGLMLRTTAPQPVTVELGEADEIRLYTDANGDIGCDHACFAGARLEP